MKTARTLRRWYRWERYMVRCERNGATQTMRQGYGRAQDILLSRLIRNGKLAHDGDWWR